jgi:hypothetical protein
MKRAPKPTSPTAKDTRGIMLAKPAKQPKALDPSKVMGKSAAKKAPKKRIQTQGQGRRATKTVY